jgi:teichuronic acid biosynthesis glycosyltransferase TuaH
VLELSARPEAAAADVVFTFSYVTWQAAAQRGWFMPEDRLARMLVTHHRVRRLLVGDLMRSLPAKLLRDITSSEAVPFPSSEHRRLLRPVRLRRRDPSSSAGARRAVAAYERALRRAAEQMGMERPVVITAHPLLAGFLDCSWARAVTFYATDDWSAYPPHRHWWPLYDESFSRVAAGGRRVAAVSAPVLERIAPTGPSAVIANGLEPAEWRGPAGMAPEWAAALPRPLLVYAGSLDSRLDVPALLALACAMPDACILLVGPLLDPEHLAPLRAAPNVEIRPALARPEIVALIRAADVGLLPHRESALTRAMSPLKLYEYLAGGLPVVAVDLPPVRGVDPRVVLVEVGGDYAEAAQAALALGRASERTREQFIERNSWQSCHDRLLDLALA